MPNYNYLFIIRYMGNYTQIRLRWKMKLSSGISATHMRLQKKSNLISRLVDLKLDHEHISPIEELSDIIQINLGALPLNFKIFSKYKYTTNLLMFTYKILNNFSNVNNDTRIPIHNSSTTICIVTVVYSSSYMASNPL